MQFSRHARISLAGLAALIAAMATVVALTPHTTGVAGSQEITWLTRLAEAGDSGAQLQLGLAYRDGRATLAPDPHAALHWFEAAARGGDAYAADALANAYVAGQGTARDPRQALRWWRVAANGGNADAQRRLGQALLAQGHDDSALLWLRRAADRGDSGAHATLVRLYHGGGTGDADLHRGENPLASAGERMDAAGLRLAFAAWHTLALSSPSEQSADALLRRAREGDPVAEYQLGMRYRDGAWGVGRDPQQARRWLQRAADAGNRVAVHTLAEQPPPRGGASAPTAHGPG